MFSKQSMRQRLSRVLRAIVNMDPQIGYVQGMNFVVAALLFHCSESVTFWLMRVLFEKFQL